MCGLAGFVNARGGPDVEGLSAIAAKMADALTARGPDDAGTWTDSECAMAMGFRRLAILDLSAEGHQPMVSRSGRFIIAFNGEIYNHQQLREQLDAQDRPDWRGHSDTEVLLECCARFSFAETLAMLNGMFAIALWDRQDKALYLARDRFGEKPLYYGRVGDAFLFGSELKALKAHPSWTGTLDWDALALFVRHAYVPGPYTAYAGIRKLPSGTWLKLTADGTLCEPQAYWSAADAALKAVNHPFTGSFDEAIDKLERLSLDAVGLRLHADVPLGAFLSGGVDSSTIAALMQAQATQPVRTFSIAFGEKSYNEAPFAAAVAKHLGTLHTEMEVSERDGLEMLTALPAMFDEPFADASQIPTALLAKLTRQHVMVALSGDGGDELFCGYGRYSGASAQWRCAQGVNPAVKGLARIANWMLIGCPGSMARRLRKRVEPLSASSPEQLYREYVSWWTTGDGVTPNHTGGNNVFTDPGALSGLEPLSLRYAVIDALTYLPDDLLVKVDRATMAASLEVRAPLLDHRIAEFAWSLPEDFKLGPGGGKRVLKGVLNRYVPRELVDRPKQGFEPPIGRWLREGLSDWADDLLAVDRLNRQGFLNTILVSKRWEEHRSGRRNWAYPLWNVLMLQAWLDAQ
jgi:asparagine synthase (glutamine-hydrolysing)